MPVSFRLQLGDAAPVQQSSTTCGAACLTVARMLANPPFAEWMLEGDVGLPRVSASARFAAYEQVVARRTNAVLGAGGRLQLPWPRALGTPPWGALHELEWGASATGTCYELGWVRWHGGAALRASFERLRRHVAPGRPALLYVGDRWLPRHVVLVLPPTAGGQLKVYESSAGAVVGLDGDAFSARRLALAGWDVPWAVIRAGG